jgi:general stress protein 26
MSQADSRRVIWSHIQNIGTCMLVTYDGEDMRARPMRGIARPDENAVWFISDAHSEKDDELAAHPRACLTFADMKDQNFVSLSGSVTRVDDRAIVAELWNEAAEAYFPNGKDDPSVILLKFVAAKGEYWDSPSNPIILAIKFLQAKMTSERPNMGVNEEIERF